ncbi:MAG: hypothetical protein II863_14395 [Kiritimatiellae bacterium]|nr:hypothetical protein [Kiritimatiellia bacterium]
MGIAFVPRTDDSETDPAAAYGEKCASLGIGRKSAVHRAIRRSRRK